jgi:hypothetical protein
MDWLASLEIVNIVTKTVNKEFIYLLDINHSSSLPLPVGYSVVWPSISLPSAA